MNKKQISRYILPLYNSVHWR